VIAAIRSIVTYLAVAVYVVGIGPPVLLLAILLRRAALLYRAGEIGVRLGLSLSGIRYTVDGPGHIRRESASVYAVNHTSNVEPPVLFLALRPLFPRLRILYKAELRKLPILTRAFDLAGFIPLERGNREQSLPAIERAAEALREGNSFLIFPEGTRSRTGELLPFKKGGFVLALKAQAPIVPVAIKGARAAMRKGSPWIQPVTIQVRFGQPIQTTGLSIDDREQLVATVRAEMERLLTS
jgi:1-acyl-sn-glycerol-3-phosphate acyltransferase